MKREDIYTLDEELPKRVKARFVSANDKYYLSNPHPTPTCMKSSSSLCFPSYRRKQPWAFLVFLKKAKVTFSLL